jgi:tetratricopeptide (TPR) repeat protein
MSMDKNAAREAYQLGMDQMGMNQLDAAIGSLGLAILRDPDFAEAYLARGIGFMRKESYRQAIADFDKADELAAGLQNVYALRGQAWRVLRNLEKAAEDYGLAVAEYPDNERYRMTRAEILEELGRPEEDG